MGQIIQNKHWQSEEELKKASLLPGEFGVALNGKVYVGTDGTPEGKVCLNPDTTGKIVWNK